jgi:hypothetical protein
MSANPYAELVDKNPYVGMVDAPTPNSGSLPANAGLANLFANVVGLPMQTVQNAANLGIAGYGSAATALGRKDLAPELIKNIPGGVENVKNMMRSTGVAGLNPDNPNPGSAASTLAYDMTSRGGFIPGGALPAAASIAAEKIGGPQWSGAGALLPQAGIAGYNAMRAPSLAKAESLNAVRDKTFNDAQDAGYVVPPSAVNPSFLGNRLESIAGKAAIGQEAAARNQAVTNALVRKELGLSENAAISEQTLEAFRNRAAGPYKEVAAIDQEAAAALQKLKQTRYDANNYHKFYDRQGNPESLTTAKQLDAEAERLETYLEDIAKNAGKPDLVQDLRHARTQIAKSYDVERALNIATGDVSARMLGRSLDRGKPLTGGLSVAGKFAEAFPQYAREGERIPTPGVSKSEALAATMFGIGGYGAMGPYGAALAALPLASGPARSALLSKPYQRRIAPSYDPVLMENNLQALTRQGILAQGQ